MNRTSATLGAEARTSVAGGPHPSRRVLLVGEFGIGNLGNEASLRAVIGDLRAQDADVALTCLCHVPDRVRAEHGIDVLPLRAPVRPADADPLRKVVGRLCDLLWSAIAVRRFDAVVVPGTGILEEVWVRPGGIPAQLFQVVLAAWLWRRPVALVSVGGDVPTNRLTRVLFTFVVRRSTYVTVRDEHSAHALHRLAPRAPRPSVRPDVAFGLPTPAPVEPSATPVVAIGVMSYYGASDDPVTGAAIHERYLSRLQQLGEHVLATGRRVRLLVGDGSDAVVAEALKARLVTGGSAPAEAVEVRLSPSFDDVMASMADCEAVVATRFHNVVAGLVLRRPTVSVSYAPKNDEVMRSVGLGEYCQPLEHLDGDLLVRQLDELLAQREAVVARLDAGVRRLDDGARTQRGELAAFLRRPRRPHHPRPEATR